MNARVFAGDTHAENKIVSLFEPSTEVIRKGKAVTPRTQIERRNRRHESSRPRRASVPVRPLSGTVLNKNG